jgi:hypothetical protein
MGRTALLVAAALVVAGVAVGLTLALRDDPPRSSQTMTTRSVGDFRPPTQPAGRTGAEPVGPAWSLAKVMKLIDGERVMVDGRRVRIRSATALCSGVGEARELGGVRRWRAFDCTYTLFRGGIDRDLEFRVSVLGKDSYLLSHFRWLGGP